VAALAPQPGERWLDVATGTGGIALRGARRGALVTGLDLSEDMLAKARAAAAESGLTIDFDPGDAEHLPYGDSAFDVVSSCFGVIFAPDPETASAELGRVCRAGGRLGLTSWLPTPDLDELYGPYLPEPLPGKERWESEGSVRELLGHDFELELDRREWVSESASGAERWELWRTAVPPFKAALATLAPERVEAFRADFARYYEGLREGDVVRERRGYLRILGRRR
jgi:SAM-dependent methyltransferase